jgi:hypothetical protein
VPYPPIAPAVLNTIQQSWIAPAGTYIGGKQPYDPGRRKLYGLSVDRPPPSQPMLGALRGAFGAVQVGWLPPPWGSQTTRKITPPSVDRPPFSHSMLGARREIFNSIGSTWNIQPWGTQSAPRGPIPTAVPPEVDNPPPYTIAIATGILQSWLPPPWGAQSAPSTLNFPSTTQPASAQPYPPSQQAALQAWQALSWGAQSAPKQKPPSVDQPPPYTSPIQAIVGSTWNTVSWGAQSAPKQKPPSVDRPPVRSAQNVAQQSWLLQSWGAQSAPRTPIPQASTQPTFVPSPPFQNAIVQSWDQSYMLLWSSSNQPPASTQPSFIPSSPFQSAIWQAWDQSYMLLWSTSNQLLPEIDNPPRYSIAALSGILQSWLPPPWGSQVAPPFTPSGPFVPPIPPVTPSIQPYGPALWWRDRESRQLIREEAERAKRIRFGILPKTEEKQVEKALKQGVEAIRALPVSQTFQADRKLEFAEAAYIAVIERELSDDLREGFSAVELWRAEIRNRVMQEEDDDMMLIIMSIYIG